MASVLVCGPMTGLPLYNCKAFDDRAHELREQGHSVITPTENDRSHGFYPEDGTPAPEGFGAEALLRNLELIERWATVVEFLPWWDFSDGAKIEHSYAKYCGKIIWYYDPPLPAEVAARIVDGPKQEAYGDPVEFFGRVAQRWDVTPVQAAVMMAEFKDTRLQRRYSRDDAIDRSGYQLIARRIAEAQDK